MSSGGLFIALFLLFSASPMGLRAEFKDCTQKVVMTEEIEYDEQMHCHHVTNDACMTKYVTVYKPRKVIII